MVLMFFFREEFFLKEETFNRPTSDVEENMFDNEITWIHGAIKMS